jgi:flagellar hook protein FlgE
MERAQDHMNLIGDNIANVNTTGFKASRMTFEDSFSQTLRAASSGSAAAGGRTGVQIGSGVATAATSQVFTQGAKAQTEVPTHLFIRGDGFFSVKNADGAEFATRAGDFHMDEATRFLVTSDGRRVQGFANAALTQRGDLKIDGEGRPASAKADAEVAKIDIRTNGEIWVTLTDGTSFRRGQVLLETFRDPQRLTRLGQNLYGDLDAAGRVGSAAPGSQGLGALEAGALELSNVDLANEFVNLITTQRAFQANARMITTSDELLQEMLSLKR